jgi:hypothetical protein
MAGQAGEEEEEEEKEEYATWCSSDGWLCWNINTRLEATLVANLAVQKQDGWEICGEEEEVFNNYSWCKGGRVGGLR